ncbi:hypothetical protein [Streptomyces iconiensis]|uniref:Uncharacterized protein n=1 Tax=Streptomyces iconiensis TaxID=1384038 RepID=A0ABT6ZQB1_9ACTN|nr:hypothetical protein [Streptomyces iconiensis]MDJ1131238.1 hypothetical protein [Streptomyces iconiensis]
MKSQAASAPALRPPPGPDAHALPAGECWDAVRVPSYLAARAIDLLGVQCGSVISDPYGSRYYWLIPANSGAEWASFPAVSQVQRLSVACWVTVPPCAHRAPPGPYWVVPFREDGYLTDPYRLHAALARTTADELGPREGSSS